MAKAKSQPIKVKLKLAEGIEPPKYGSDGAAAVDVIANIDKPITLKAGETVKIPTGIYMDMTETPDLCAIAMPRSGLGSKGLVLANTIGLLDNDYQGQAMIVAFNRNPAVVMNGMGVAAGPSLTIEPGMRLAQVMFTRFERVSFEVQEQFDSETERGEGGFGSTGE